MSSNLPVSFDDKAQSDLLGPFRFLIKLTLLDCSTKSKCCGLLTTLIAIGIIVALLARVGLLMETDGKPLSFAWAECNFFGFPAIFPALSAVSILSWTKSLFFPNFVKKLIRLRNLRLEPNQKLDSYGRIHVVALIFSIPWLIAMMSWILYNYVENATIYFGATEESKVIYRVALIISNFYIWFISTVCLAFFVLVFTSINREVSHFNQELEKSKNEKTLKSIGILEKFDFRQNEILELILFANQSLSSFGSVTPLFLFYGLINGVYLTSFFDDLPTLYKVILGLNLAAIIIYNFIILSTACALQEHLATSTRILINHYEFECSKDSTVYQTYRLMVDRFQKVDTRMYVVSAIPITRSTFAAASFIVPNMGFLLVIIKKVLIENGGHV
ncbi:Gustatory receptor [Caenorhabditis elegans]|uniref:Gustatory receptor n=1 Tax=Caenorhabditis elegans TaxID=6239 RepID=Q9XVJ4_CAEEL|nr:Gustatory receptor [Caenorhabditis elegans]CAB03264.2 Gustatory receptor [Caenorhabditis elegans]